MTWFADFTGGGFARIEQVLNPEQVEDLRKWFEKTTPTHARSSAVFANRSALADPAIRGFASSSTILELVCAALEKPAFAVRAIMFDKVEGANWSVPWHQDLTVAVKDRRDVDGYGPWSIKESTPHVQPPRNVLEQMVSVRLHLDDCSASNGALRVIPGTHTLGKLSSSAVEEVVRRGPEVTCECSRGDALLMRPLLLHASSSAASPSHRRVLHIDYAACELSGGVEWLHRVH